MRSCGMAIQCADCHDNLAIFPTSFLSVASGWFANWFMVKDRVWRRGQLKGKCRFLCVGCLEHRIGRKLSAADFRRNARVNFTSQKSAKLRQRMRGLKPAKRLVETTFKLGGCMAAS